MPIYRTLQIISFLSIAFAACDKESSKPSRVELLTRAPWKMQEFTSNPAFPVSLNGQQQYLEDIMRFLQSNNSCQADQRLQFDSGDQDSGFGDKLYNSSTGNSSCGSQATSVSGQWFFQDDDDQEIYLYTAQPDNIGLLNDIYKVHQLNYYKLTISYRVQISGASQIYEFKKTFVHDVD